jgi:succinate dehydrogenase/fumarate reductase flavoprotein subunit
MTIQATTIMPLKIIVVGAGIAGLCAALALRQQGCEVKVSFLPARIWKDIL